MNKVFLIGTVANSPELRFIPNGQAVLNFSVATKETWFKDGVQKEHTAYHRCVCWGKRGEELATVLAQDVPIVVEGKLKHSTYDDKDGKKVYKTDVEALSVELFFAPPGDQGSGQAPDAAPAQDAPYRPKPNYGPPGNQIPFGAPPGQALAQKLSGDDFKY